MTQEQFLALKVGDTLYRFDGGLREYGVTSKTPYTIQIDRPCVLSSAIVTPGAGRRLMQKTVLAYFYVTAAGAYQAEKERLLEIINYHRSEKDKVRRALIELEGSI